MKVFDGMEVEVECISALCDITGGWLVELSSHFLKSTTENRNQR